ncbi:Bud site selection protein 6 [Coemansia erecta]|nr:Bud site selection protein 6 [Coemansia erecta]
MEQTHVGYRGINGRSPEPLEYTAPAFAAPSRPSPLPRNYNNNYSNNNYSYGAPSGSLRSTRSTNNAYARGELPAGTRAVQPRRGHAFTAEPHAFDGNNAFRSSASPPPPQQQQRAHLQPFVPDASERRTPDMYTQTIDYSYRRGQQAPLSVPSGPVVTTFPEDEYMRTTSARKFRSGDYEDGGAGPSNNVRYARRGSSASSQNDALSGRASPRAPLGNARLIAGRAKATRDSIGMALSPPPRPVPSSRVEFGFSSPAMATLAQSPEHDEIADIIADMTKTRISPLNIVPDVEERPRAHVLLQLGDDVKRAVLEGAPSLTLLVNLFIEKYQSRLAEDPEALPEIYIRDPKSKVFYELEDMADVVDGAVLSWRTKPLVESKAGISAESNDAKSVESNDAKPVEPNDESSAELNDKGPAESQPADNKDHGIADLAKTVAALAETVAALPAQLTSELNGAMQQLQDRTSTAIESMSTQVQRSLATQPQPSPIAPSAMDVDDGKSAPATPSITRSASMPVANSEDTEKLRKQLRKAEMELGIERQKHQEAVSALETEKSTLSSELDKLRKDVSSHPNVLRVRIEEGKLMLKNEYRAQNSLFEDVHGMVQEMRKDVAQRGSIPSAQMMKKANAELKTIEEGTQKLIKFINETRSDWKRTWEEELQNILKEQSFVKDVEQMLGELLDDTKHLDDVLDKLDKIIGLKLKERSKDDYVPAAATKFIDVVAPDDARDAKGDLFKQITCVDIDHQRRVDALKAAERLRLQELAAKVNEFDDELSDFVSQRKLRKTGGTEELERRRAEKNVEIMKDMLKSAEEAEQARRAKIAQRKAAKKQPKERPPTSSSSKEH